MHLLRHRWTRLARSAWANRQELIAARLTTRRDLLKLGLITGAGLLAAKHGLSSRASDAEVFSPPTRAWVDPLPRPAVRRPLAGGARALAPYPAIVPNNAQGEGRTRPHQAFGKYPDLFPWPPQVVYETRLREAPHYFSPDLPLQELWGFDGVYPGMTYHARQGEQILVRVRNDELPRENGGFGLQSNSIHLHNSHTPSESDGFPGDYFPDPERRAIARAFFYDHHYPNALAGFGSTHRPLGDPNEALSTLWYHDHRVEFTGQNVYKGLAGFYLMFNDRDTGDETTGFRLPGVRQGDFHSAIDYDIPLVMQERIFDPETGQLFFDLFEKDGILGDKNVCNGKIQPYLEVEPRRYRFRILGGGPARFHQFFLTDRGANTAIAFWQVSNDGNLLPRALKATSVITSIGERVDVVVDFAPWAGRTLYIEDRLRQDDGGGAEKNFGERGSLLRPGRGRFFLQLRVGTRVTVPDRSVDFEAAPVHFYPLPPREAPRITRTFDFDRTKGQWAVNSRLFPADSSVVHFRVRQNSAEHWNVNNRSGGWMHPFHTHCEEFQVLRRSGRAVAPGDPHFARHDVLALMHNDFNTVFFRFRDFEGRYTVHCHNPTHEDHAMMLRFDIDEAGDSKERP